MHLFFGSEAESFEEPRADPYIAGEAGETASA